jgi:apolipoprotein N-acyltransferase
MLRKIIGSSIFAGIFSGVLLALPFNNGNLWFFSWFALVPILLKTNNKRLKQIVKLFFVSGITFWGLVIYWLANVTLLGVIVLSLYLSLYFILFGLFLYYNIKSFKSGLLIFAPSAWVLLEYARSHIFTGFPWALLGYSQYLNLPLVQIADIFGIWGVSFFLIFSNVAIAEILQFKKKNLFLSLKITLAVITAVVFLVLFYGFYRLSFLKNIEPLKKINISVIQPNISQRLKWDPAARNFIMQRCFELTDEAVLKDPELIIWPEAALPVVLEEEPVYYQSLKGYVNTIKKNLIFGAVTQRRGLYYNSALLLSEKGELISQYDKLHLVPFGEFVPFRRVVKVLDKIAPIGDISKGKDYTIFTVLEDFGVLICFEDVFPGLARNFVRYGAKFLVNITNDAWFGKTPEAYQHLSASVLRAIENRVNVVRSANTGISAFISPMGKIFDSVKASNKEALFVPGHKSAVIQILNLPKTFYNLYGDFLPVFCLLYILLSVIFRGRFFGR